MKGVILCGGKGTRLLPATKNINKHLVPILNTPMVMFPLETLKSLGIRDILIVSGGDHIGGFTEFLGDGSDFDVNLTYRVQQSAGGIAQALGLAEAFSGRESVAVILGDNIFDHGVEMDVPFVTDGKAHLFVKEMPAEEARRFGVVQSNVITGDHIIEKPQNIETETARVVTGLYVYPPEVFDIIKMQKPSARGEYEITDINNYFLLSGTCKIHEIKGFWSDSGTPESLFITTEWAYNNSKKQKDGYSH